MVEAFAGSNFSVAYDYKNNSNLLASMEGPVHAVSYSYGRQKGVGPSFHDFC
jgi:hypothetical protein